MYTNDESIQELIKYADSGKIQLPDFQRGWVWDVVSMRKDEFDLFFYKRAIAILDAIEQVTGKTVPGRNSDEVVQKFGDEL